MPETLARICSRWSASILLAVALGASVAVSPSPAVPEIDDLYVRQARELDPKKREATVHQIQQIIRDKVTAIPLFEQAFIWGVGPKVADAGDGRIPGFSYSAPFEDLKLK